MGMQNGASMIVQLSKIRFIIGGSQQGGSQQGGSMWSMFPLENFFKLV